MRMKKITRIIIAIILLQIAAVGVIIGTSKVQDVTLATDDVTHFNIGWVMRGSDGTRTVITSMPYYGKSKPDELVIAENYVDESMCGKTLSFLSADKKLEIYVGNEKIYSFGMQDRQLIGSTPGSVMVFADIPEGSAGKLLQIRMQSPYADYATYMTDMVIGDRDVDILYFMKQKTVPLLCCFGILICGIILLIFAAIMKKAPDHHSSSKLFSLGMYFLVIFIYHMIETKIPMIYYGNQVLYSNLVFVSLMTAPFCFELYLYSATNHLKKTIQILVILTSVNILGQLVLQGLNIFDFMTMAFVSHGMLFIVIVVMLFAEIQHVREQRKISFSCVGLFVVAVCGLLDLIRCYTVKVGDLGKYSRIGMLVLGVCMVISCIQEVVQLQLQYAENEKAEIISGEIIQALVTAIDAKDIYTKGHSARVAEYAVILAKELGWEEERVNRVRYKALLHDVGKIGIPDRVLNKADRLTDEEFEIIKSHTTIGAEMLKGVSSLADMYLVAEHHHERYDGRGYPEGIAGDEIPEEARLVGIVDAYDAMASDRAYRKALPEQVILGELQRARGTQLDPDMTDVFIGLLNDGKLKLGTSDDAAQEQKLDMSSIVSEMIHKNATPGAIKMDQENMNKIYQYLSGMRTRYGIEFDTVSISLVWEDDVPISDVKDAMKAMEYSILQSLRKVDIMSRISESQYLIVLTQSQEQNVQMIVDRIFASFFKNCQNTRIKPTYEMHTDIGDRMEKESGNR